MLVFKGFPRKNLNFKVLITLDIGCHPKENMSKFINVKRKVINWKLRRLSNLKIQKIKKRLIQIYFKYIYIFLKKNPTP